MNGNHNWSYFNNPGTACATFKQATYPKKQIWLKTSTKKNKRIRKIGISAISLFVCAILLILSRL